MKDVLFIRAKVEHKPWLEYILAEFASIQLFQGRIEVVALEKVLPAGVPVINYTRNFIGGICLYECAGVLPRKDVVWAEDDVYIVPGTAVMDRRFVFLFDALWNAFVFLSGLEEHLLAQQGRLVLSHGLTHPRGDKSTFLVPVVNMIFSRLEFVIRKEFPCFVFGEKPLPVIDLSHDVDYLAKSPVFVFKQSILNAYDLMCSLHRPKECLYSFKRALRFLGTRTSLWCFKEWCEFEKSQGFRSIFYIHAKVKDNFLTRFIDPDYDLLRCPALGQQLRALVSDGFAVGLHGSFFSAEDEVLVRQEKKILEDVMGMPIARGRQHWLRFVQGVTPYIHEKVFEADSTLGWNDWVGFRHGCASAFHPYDHLNQRAFKYVEIPQVIMDFNLFQSLGLEDKDHMKQARRLLINFYDCKSAHVSVSWHQQTCSADYGWFEAYKQLVGEYAAKRRG